MIKFSNLPPQTKNINLGTGYFDITVDIPAQAELLAQNQIELHYKIAKDLLLKKGILSYKDYTGDICAVFKKSENQITAGA